MSDNLHNTPTSQIIDEYGDLNLQAKAIEARLKELKEELIRREVVKDKGMNYSLTVTDQISMRLDTKALKAALGEDICKEYEMPISSTVVRVKQALPEINMMRAA